MRLIVAGLGLATVLTCLAAPAAVADDNPLCDSVESTTTDSPVTLANAPFSELGVHRAQVLAKKAGTPARPVRVAVLDSGVDDTRIPVRERHSVTGKDAATYFHGTAVAGLVAGPLGVAPQAEIVDVRVYDDEDEGVQVSADPLAAGLDWVARNAGRLNIRVANVSLAVHPSADLARAVAAVRRAHVVLVAASGNRPEQGAPFDEDFADGTASPDEDAAGIMYPTSYPGVVSASSTADGTGSTDVTQFVVRNSNTTVAVPTYDAVSWGLNDRPCVLEPAATSWAAAEVSGVLALLAQAYPHDTDEQLVARLVETANGRSDDPTSLIGAGVVQPVEALTRPLDPSRSGQVDDEPAAEPESVPAGAPAPQEDLLAGTRHDAVWWGLIGGGVLVVALLLRPVIARRRP